MIVLGPTRLQRSIEGASICRNRPIWICSHQSATIWLGVAAVGPSASQPSAIGLLVRALAVWVQVDRSPKSRKLTRSYCGNRPMGHCGNRPMSRTGIWCTEMLSTSVRISPQMLIPWVWEWQVGACFSASKCRLAGLFGTSSPYSWCLSTSASPPRAAICDDRPLAAKGSLSRSARC